MGGGPEWQGMGGRPEWKGTRLSPKGVGGLGDQMAGAVLMDKMPAPAGLGLYPPPPLRPFYCPGSVLEPRVRLQNTPGGGSINISGP